MNALERINHAYLELISATEFGETRGQDIAADLRENCCWDKVYLSDETTDHWMDLMSQETFRAQSLYILAPSQHLEQLMAVVNGWNPSCIITRKTSYKTPYHSLILHFNSN